MATSGPIVWSFGQKPRNFINQEEWPVGPPQKKCKFKSTKVPIRTCRSWMADVRELAEFATALALLSAAELHPGSAGPRWQICDVESNLPQLQSF